MATDKLQFVYYDVTQWTAFKWNGEEEKEGERVQNMTRAAKMIERKLRTLCPRYAPSVTSVHAGLPQLCFRFRVPAEDEARAEELLAYYVQRGLTTKIATGRGRTRVTLQPPMGKREIKRVERAGS